MSSLTTALLTLTLSLPAPVSSWSVVPTPNPSMAANRLRAITAAGPGDVWSVGNWQDNLTGRQRPLTQRWDGRSWQTVDSPASRTGHDSLTAVAGTGPTDLWAVGFTALSTHNPDSLAEPDHPQPLILRGNGLSWTPVAPEPVGVSAHLAAVDMISGSDGWAVGSYLPQEGAAPRGLILRWTGTTWRHVPEPDLGSRPVRLTGISGTTADDVWAVGYLGAIGSAAEAILLHWDGRAWKQEPLDLDRSVQSALFSVSGPWAVGYTWSAGKRMGFALHRGQRVPVDVIQEGTQLRSVVATPEGVWAVGYYINGGVDNALVMTYNGTAFVKEAPPHPGPMNVAGTALSGITANPATGELWAVGCLDTETRVLRRDTGVR